MSGIASALLSLGLLLLEVYAASAYAGDAPHGCSVEKKEVFLAAGAFDAFFNHVAFFLSSMTICPVLSDLAFGVKLHPKAEILLCFTHGGLCCV